MTIISVNELHNLYSNDDVKIIPLSYILPGLKMPQGSKFSRTRCSREVNADGCGCRIACALRKASGARNRVARYPPQAASTCTAKPKPRSDQRRWRPGVRPQKRSFRQDAKACGVGRRERDVAVGAALRRLLSRLEDGHYRVAMDQGSWVDVRITVDRQNRRARVDYSATSMEQPNNFNAPAPVTRAATLYVFRVMVNEPIPMNAGCLKPVDIVIPERSMLRPSYPAAVVAGNVETSQVVTNCLFAAMKALGSSQGTMNNLTFGNDRVQYYETICGGSGAGVLTDGDGGALGAGRRGRGPPPRQGPRGRRPSGTR